MSELNPRLSCISCGSPVIDGGGHAAVSTQEEPMCQECVSIAQGKMQRMHVYLAIDEERAYQDKKHGDHKHSVSEWLSIMGFYANKANEAFAAGGERSIETMLDCMRKIVASGVACMEQNGVVGREYASPKSVCDVCGDTEAEHKPDAGHAFIGAVFEWPPEPVKPKIDAMVDVFLSWPLPESVRSDMCATMTPEQFPHPRSGTNLMTATEARQMFEHVLAKVQESDVTRRANLIKKLNEGFTPEGDAALSRLAAARHKSDCSVHNEPAYANGPCDCGAIVPIMKSDFQKDIEDTINRYSKENGSNTPDFIVAQYLIDSLAAYDKAVMAREKWYGREPKPVPHHPECQALDTSLPGQCDCMPTPPPVEMDVGQVWKDATGNAHTIRDAAMLAEIKEQRRAHPTSAWTFVCYSPVGRPFLTSI